MSLHARHPLDKMLPQAPGHPELEELRVTGGHGRAMG